MPALLLLFGIFGLAILPHVCLAILEFLRQCVSSVFLASHDDDPVIEAWYRHALANTLRYGGVAVAALAYSLSCDAEGAERMRANVCEVEWLLLTGARLFHACQYGSLLLYHLVDPDAVFPATISFSIRRGAPRYLHHALWLGGWCATTLAVRRAGSATDVAFCCQMVVTGMVVVIFAPVGRGVKTDMVHTASAALYIFDHHYLLRLLSVPLEYCVGYYASFALFALGLTESKRLERAAGLPEGLDEGPPLHAALERTGSRRRHWWARLLVMVAEYATFTFFVAGFVADLPAECAQRSSA